MNETTRKYFMEVHMVREEEYVESLIQDCESPLEELFMLAFYSCEAKEQTESYIEYKQGCRCRLMLEPQANIGKYRVDFLVQIIKDDQKPSIYVIEIDGHEFHEKTKKQVEHRNSRDRFFASKGILVLHFSGSEVYNNPDECVDAVCSCIIENEVKEEE